MDATADTHGIDAPADRHDRPADRPADLDDDAAELVRRHADAILRLKARAQELSDHVAAEYASARAAGLDRRALAELVRRLSADADEVREQGALVALYEDAYHLCGLRAALRGDRGRADA